MTIRGGPRRGDRSTAPRRPGWKDVPASGDLAALTRCEAEYVWERRYGSRPSAQRKAASERGVREHDRVQVAMEAHHNRPRPARSGSGASSGRAAPASARDKRCFVATAVYGPTAVETDQLRAFRDRRLMTWGMGRGLVAVYYLLSPLLVRWLSDRPRWTAVVRRMLDVFRRSVCGRGSGRFRASGTDSGPARTPPRARGLRRARR
jgi:hypothetical protein